MPVDRSSSTFVIPQHYVAQTGAILPPLLSSQFTGLSFLAQVEESSQIYTEYSEELDMGQEEKRVIYSDYQELLPHAPVTPMTTSSPEFPTHNSIAGRTQNTAPN
ncbi:uncharacterized protein ARMOST_10576 [Armillaria ostoyae]|uniref:Uncharacterized protein n=1 Tax=Armillaria ostoyae TaxID=47428 RepID=A0A284RER8_ARMOS|nr:uncharacterized protein ARMOST_10576 [Armillaria ostoyae]